jgi:ParB family transcriptional regulator, chromosome partitioning protein
MREGKMKKAFDLSAITADLPTLPEEGEAATENARPRSSAVPIAKAIETQHRNAMAQLKALEAKIEQNKAEGLVIEEIDPALADPSPYWDRDVRFLRDKSYRDFVEDIRRNGQQSPALLRQHPTDAGRFEVCFGHRRLFACRSLGTRLRAVVQNLSEAQMAGAAYSENAHREGVSTLEQSRALAKYVERGVFPTKQALADALNVSRSHVSNLTSYAEIPDRVLEALGDWRKCTFRDANNLLKVTREPTRRALMIEAAERLIGGDPQLGFHVRLMVLLGQKAAKSVETENLRDDFGRLIAERKRGKRSSAIAFAADQGEGLADFVWSKMPSLIEEFRRQQNDRA